MSTSLGLSSETVKNESEWDVDLYQQQHSFVWKYGSSLLDILDNELAGYNQGRKLRIIDVGCGSGELTKEVYQRRMHKGSCRDIGLEVLGMDNDGNMVTRAQEENSLNGQIEFFQSDVCKLSPTTEITTNNRGTPVLGQFDAIISNACLHWVHEAEDAVVAMSSILKPGGIFIVEFGGRGNVQSIVEASKQVLQRKLQHNMDLSFQPWYFPSIGEYTSILERNDIEVMNAILYDRPTPLDDGENGMKNWLTMFGGPILDGFVTGETTLSKEEIIDEIVELLRPNLYNYQEHRWTADYRRIRIIGRKIGE